MSYGPYEDYMPCCAEGCEAIAHDWDEEGVEQRRKGEYTIDIAGIPVNVVVWLCPEHAKPFQDAGLLHEVGN